MKGKGVCSSQDGGRKPLAGRKTPKETQAHRQWPQALMGEAELRTIIRNKKRKTPWEKVRKSSKGPGCYAKKFGL